MHSSSGKGSKSSGKEGQCCLSSAEENKSWKNISFYHKERMWVFFFLKKKKKANLFFVCFSLEVSRKRHGMAASNSDGTWAGKPKVLLTE